MGGDSNTEDVFLCVPAHHKKKGLTIPPSIEGPVKRIHQTCDDSHAKKTINVQSTLGIHVFWKSLTKGKLAKGSFSIGAHDWRGEKKRLRTLMAPKTKLFISVRFENISAQMVSFRSLTFRTTMKGCSRKVAIAKTVVKKRVPFNANGPSPTLAGNTTDCP